MSAHPESGHKAATAETAVFGPTASSVFKFEMSLCLSMMVAKSVHLVENRVKN